MRSQQLVYHARRCPMLPALERSSTASARQDIIGWWPCGQGSLRASSTATVPTRYQQLGPGSSWK